MWLFSVPRLAREAASLVQDVQWLAGLAKDAWKKPAPSAPEMELSRTWRLGARAPPEPWAREYEAWDPGWTLVRPSYDPFYEGRERVL